MWFDATRDVFCARSPVVATGASYRVESATTPAGDLVLLVTLIKAGTTKAYVDASLGVSSANPGAVVFECHLLHAPILTSMRICGAVPLGTRSVGAPHVHSGRWRQRSHCLVPWVSRHNAPARSRQQCHRNRGGLLCGATNDGRPGCVPDGSSSEPSLHASRGPHRRCQCSCASRTQNPHGVSTPHPPGHGPAVVKLSGRLVVLLGRVWTLKRPTVTAVVYCNLHPGK